MSPRPWFTSGLVTVVGVLLTTVSLVLLGIRQHDVDGIERLIQQNADQERQIAHLTARQESVLHELDRMRDRLERLEQRR